MQVIEGEDEKINQLLLKIQNDRRHKNMIILMKEKIERRNFPDLSIGFKNLSNKKTDGFSPYLNYDSRNEEDKILAGKAKTLLQEFREHNH